MNPPEIKSPESFPRVLRAFWGLIQEIKIYPPQHPRLSQSLQRLHAFITPWLEGQAEFTFAVVANEIVFQNKPLIELSESFAGLIQIFSKGNFSKIAFTPGLTEPELFAFCQVLSQDSDRPPKDSSWKSHLSGKQISHITCDVLSAPTVNRDPEFSSPSEVFDYGVDTLKQLDQAISSGKQIDYGYLMHLVNLITPQVLAHREDLLLLGSLKSHHEYTFEHVMNVAVLSCALGAALGLPESVLHGICMGAVLHDIGKRAIPHSILDKAGKLTPEEVAIMETHPFEGAKMIFLEGNLGDLPMAVAMEHHLNFDGTGYPALKRRRPMSLASRIVTITDFNDALRATRVYRGEMSPEAVYHLMQDLRDKKFDPELLDIFFETIGVYPPGIPVELDTRETATVLKANPEDIFRPEVQLETDASGKRLSTPLPVSLTEKMDGKYTRTIVRSIPPTPTPQNKPS